MSTLNQGLGVRAGGAGGGGGGTDENLGNTDLQADDNRKYDINAKDLTFSNGGTEIAKFVASTGNLQIGATNKYSMPTARGTTNEILIQTNNSGTSDWKTQTNLIANEIQVDAGSGATGTIAGRAGEFYIGEIDRQRVISLGAVTQTSLNTGAFIHLLAEFKNNNATTVGGLVKGNINLKFTCATPATFKIYVLKLQMTDGVSVAATPSSFIPIGDVSFAGARETGTWKCIKLPTEVDGNENAACCNYYVGIVPDDEGEINFTYIASFESLNTITSVYS